MFHHLYKYEINRVTPILVELVEQISQKINLFPYADIIFEL